MSKASWPFLRQSCPSSRRWIPLSSSQIASFCRQTYFLKSHCVIPSKLDTFQLKHVFLSFSHSLWKHRIFPKSFRSFRGNSPETFNHSDTISIISTLTSLIGLSVEGQLGAFVCWIDHRRRVPLLDPLPLIRRKNQFTSCSPSWNTLYHQIITTCIIRAALSHLISGLTWAYEFEHYFSRPQMMIGY